MTQPEHQGSDFQFEYRWVPNNYSARVQRSAVLYPLLGMARSVEQITSATSNLVKCWRARVTQLSYSGWDANWGPKGLAYARNCVPTFVKALPSSRPCRMNRLCPFCYARWVGDIWNRIDQAFPNVRRDGGGNITINRQAMSQPVEGDIPETTTPETHHRGRPLRAIQLHEGADQPIGFPFHLIEQRKNVTYPYDECGPGSPELLRKIVMDGNQFRAYWVKMHKMEGAFCSNFVAPGKKGWELQFRGLYKVRPDFEFVAATGGKVERHEQPTRRIIASAVSRTCRYPRAFMFGDVAQMAMLLTSQQGRRVRLTATYGDFRKSKLRDLQNEQ